MKKISLSIDEHVLQAVRRYAMEQNASVNALVREFLTGLAEREARVQTARQRILELSDKSTARIGEKTWSRDDLHKR